MSPRPALVLLLLALGCSNKYDTDTGDLTTVDGEDGGSDGADGQDGLPDLLANLDRDLTDCQGYDGVPVAGAVSYYWGQYEGNENDGWVGEERWILIANDRWQENDGEDCEIVWSVTARAADPGACGSCDLGIVGQASIQTARTTCPSGLWTGSENLSLDYGVFRAGDGGATWYFAGSGNRMAEGFHDPSGDLNYLTDKACKWF